MVNIQTKLDEMSPLGQIERVPIVLTMFRYQILSRLVLELHRVHKYRLIFSIEWNTLLFIQ